MNLANIRTRLDNIADETVISSKANAWINDVYQDVASRYGWSWLKGSGTFVTSDGDHDYTVAADKDRILSMKTKDRELTGRTMDWLYMNYPEYPEYTDAGVVQTGSPSDYIEYENEVNLYPVPDGSYTVSYLYKKTITELTSDSDIPVIPTKFHEVLVLGAYVKWLLADEADQNMINNGKNEYEQMIERMIADEQVNEQTSQDLSWGRR